MHRLGSCFSSGVSHMSCIWRRWCVRGMIVGFKWNSDQYQTGSLSAAVLVKFHDPRVGRIHAWCWWNWGCRDSTYFSQVLCSARRNTAKNTIAIATMLGCNYPQSPGTFSEDQPCLTMVCSPEQTANLIRNGLVSDKIKTSEVAWNAWEARLLLFTLYVFIVVHSWTLLDHTRSVDTADGRNWWLETHASEHNDCSVFTLLY